MSKWILIGVVAFLGFFLVLGMFVEPDTGQEEATPQPATEPAPGSEGVGCEQVRSYLADLDAIMDGAETVEDYAARQEEFDAFASNLPAGQGSLARPMDLLYAAAQGASNAVMMADLPNANDVAIESTLEQAVDDAREARVEIERLCPQ